MRTNQSKLTTGVLAACFVVALAGVGCGDDEPTDAGVAGSGGAAGAAGAAGMAGTSGGGGGGTGGGAGAGPNATMCIANVASVTMNMVSPTCATCVCNMGLAAANACNASAMGACWGLIGCIRDNCPDRSCATTTCGMFLAGAGPATTLGEVLTGPCATACPIMSDGGAADAGI